jgi:hypothetical protein
MVTYWSYYRDFFKIHPGSKTLMLFRPPVTPLFFGVLFDLFGPAGVQTVLSLLYVLCLVTVYAIGASLSAWVGFLALMLLGADIQYYYWFFSVGSESPQSFLVVFWMAYAFFTFQKTKARYWVIHAIVVWLLILNRPGNQVMIFCALFPLFHFHTVWKRRLILSLVFFVSYGVCHIAYASFNYARVGVFQVSTLGNALMPFYRIYLQDALVSSENGPKSIELAQLVEKEILPLAVFQKYQIDKEIFFKMPSQRMYNKLLGTVEKVYGWDDQWLLLRQVAMEAAVKHPRDFFLTYFDHVRDVFYVRGNGSYDLSPQSSWKREYNKFLQERYKQYAKLGIPIPDEGDLLPKSETGTAANSNQENYTAQTFFHAKTPPVTWTFPGRYCSYHWGDIFDIYDVKFPFTFLFICIGLLGTVLSLLRRVTSDYLAILCIFFVSFLTLSVTLMGSVQLPFRFPFDSIFILLGCFGLHGIVAPRNISKKIPCRL